MATLGIDFGTALDALAGEPAQDNVVSYAFGQAASGAAAPVLSDLSLSL